MDLNFFRLIIDKGGCCSIDNRCIRCGEIGASCVVLLLNDEGGKGGVHSLSTAFEGAYSLSSIFRLALFALFFILLGILEGIICLLAIGVVLVTLTFLGAGDACF